MHLPNNISLWSSLRDLNSACLISCSSGSMSKTEVKQNEVERKAGSHWWHFSQVKVDPSPPTSCWWLDLIVLQALFFILSDPGGDSCQAKFPGCCFYCFLWTALPSNLKMQFFGMNCSQWSLSHLPLTCLSSEWLMPNPEWSSPIQLDTLLKT